MGFVFTAGEARKLKEIFPDRLTRINLYGSLIGPIIMGGFNPNEAKHIEKKLIDFTLEHGEVNEKIKERLTTRQAQLEGEK